MDTKKTLVNQAHDFVMPKILKHCQNYEFHNAEHTKNVFERASYLALAEWVHAEDTEDLQIAALFHDMGFLEQYPKNEYQGAQIARKWLEEKKHPEHRIQKIEGIIMATVLFSKPKNILEEIIQDSDLDNIGTRKSFENSQNLYAELKNRGNINMTECAFWQFSYRVHNNFEFHTKTAKSERSVQRQKNHELIAAYLKMLGCSLPYEQDNMEKII